LSEDKKQDRAGRERQIRRPSTDKQQAQAIILSVKHRVQCVIACTAAVGRTMGKGAGVPHVRAKDGSVFLPECMGIVALNEPHP
jgi:hypothetical protein